jgi:regulator of cell morphogenesis and NO signaling
MGRELADPNSLLPMGPSPRLHATQPETAQLLQRYHQAPVHQLVYTYEELKELGVPPEFLLAIVEVFENPAAFRAEAFGRFRLQTIIDYLQKTHQYYLNKKLPEIEQSIMLLMRAYPQAHPLLLLLHNFYNSYKTHLQRHIEAEESSLLPYVRQLEQYEEANQKQSHAPGITVQQFMHEHHDTEKDLADVRNAMLHYSPPDGSSMIYRILASQLEILERDLAVHALMEDEVLLPRALALEEKWVRPNT